MVNAFVLAVSAFFNERGNLDVGDLGCDAFRFPSFPFSGDLRVVLVLSSDPGEYTTAAVRIGIMRPDKSISETHEFLDDWPSVPGRGFSTCRLTYSIPLTIHEPGTHGLVLFVADDATNSGLLLFEVEGPAAA